MFLAGRLALRHLDLSSERPDSTGMAAGNALKVYKHGATSMAESLPTVEMELEMDVERGPNWLLVKLHPGHATGIRAPHVADELWSLMSRHFTYRLVLEMDELGTLPGGMTEQLAELRERIAERGGSLRLCGLSHDGEAELSESQLAKSLPNHRDRVAAVWG